mmetsp:Transcript_27781/g.79963  ORF Transcript_27781/g.79963 Transcript_27781/m.79963 type:complete len:224 (+) Transcript_27781:2419-3090(+)
MSYGLSVCCTTGAVSRAACGAADGGSTRLDASTLADTGASANGRLLVAALLIERGATVTEPPPTPAPAPASNLPPNGCGCAQFAASGAGPRALGRAVFITLAPPATLTTWDSSLPSRSRIAVESDGPPAGSPAGCSLVRGRGAGDGPSSSPSSTTHGVSSAKAGRSSKASSVSLAASPPHSSPGSPPTPTPPPTLTTWDSSTSSRARILAEGSPAGCSRPPAM